MTQFICDNKYQIAGPNEDTIGLPIVVSDLPEKIEIEDCTLLRRTSFHVSLVCIGKIIEKNGLTIPNFKEKIIADFCDFTQEYEIAMIQFRDEFKFAAEDEKRSVVRMCEILNLDKLFDLINKKYSLNLEYPPTHATLFTLQPDVGIFLTDSDDINRLTKEIKNPIEK